MGCLFWKKQDSFDVENFNAHGLTKDRNLQGEKGPAKSVIPWRYYIATLGFIAVAMTNCQRLAFAVAIVNMTNSTSLSTSLRNMTSCPVLYNTTTDSPKSQTGGEFNWSPEMRGIILGAQFLGYAVTPSFGGRMADKFGAKRMILWGNSVAALCMLLCPIASVWHAYCVATVQFVKGIAQGVIMPSTYAMMANWTPRSERGFISSFILTGFCVGAIVGGSLAGLLCKVPILGWRSVFYVFGGVGVLYSILFAITFYETPKDHPRISQEELKYITEDQERKSEKKPPTPWLKMFTSIPTYALMYGLFGHFWSEFYFLSIHPTYLSTILHYPISENGLMSSIPFMMKIISSLLASSVSDWLYRKKYAEVDKLRKGCTFIGCLGFSLCLLGVYAAECNGLVNNVLFAVAMLASGISIPGAMIAAVDMTPNFAATMMGVLSTVARTSGFLIPVIAGFLTKDETLEEWQMVFFINIGVVMSSGLVFAIFGSAEVQEWNYPADEIPPETPGIKQNFGDTVEKVSPSETK